MQVMEMPRTVVKGWLGAVRLPLSVLESMSGRRGEEWMGSMAFDAFASTVKRTAGTALRDRELVEEGRLLRAKVRKLREATLLEGRAEQKRIEAEAELRQRRRQVEEQRDDVEERIDRQAEAVERQTEAERRRVQKEAAQRRQEAQKAAAARDRVVAEQERAARETRVEEQAEALEEKRDAVEVRAEVAQIDEAIERTKARRKTGS